MATLTRTRQIPDTSSSFQDEADNVMQRRLQLEIPKPFPNRNELELEEELEALENEELTLEMQCQNIASKDQNAQAEASTSHGIQTITHAETLNETINDRHADDLVPSIANVQMLCLTTLNDLLSDPKTKKPIIPDRRHSLPASAHTLTSPTSPVSALETLVTNLRAHGMQPNAASSSSQVAFGHTELLEELHDRVDRLAQQLPSASALLARTLVSLATHTHQLSLLHTAPATSSQFCLSLPRPTSWAAADGPFARLRHDLSGLRLQEGAGPVQEVEAALLWAKLDEELEQVLSLCRAPAPFEESAPPDYQPPEYEHSNEYEWEDEGLPRYEMGASGGVASELKSPAKHGPIGSPLLSTSNEKMRMDLEAVTLAIDRLYFVAPQLHDQRVELKKSKLEQMERARAAGTVQAKTQKEGNHQDMKELDEMLAMLGKAADRKLVDQSVVLEGGIGALLEKTRLRDQKKREAFVTHLAEHSNAGRLHSQDAVLPGTRQRDPNAMLTLPEFIRESVPSDLKNKMKDPQALLTLPEFVQEEMPNDLAPSRPPPLPLRSRKSLSFKGTRSRSMSAPPLAWLLQSASSSRSVSPLPSAEQKKTKISKRPGSSSGPLPVNKQSNLDISYVAEYHENLQHVLVFMNVSGMKSGVDLEAEVLADAPGGAGEHLLLRRGDISSPLLSLPAKIHPGKKEVKVSGEHYEIKLPVASGSRPLSQIASPTLLDATELTNMHPSSYICASCSLPLVHSSRLAIYRDLPSEHWEELVDAWMCHADQKLHSHVVQRTTEGFWPSEDLALVGGSYILFDASAMVQNNHWLEERKRDEDEWQRVRCICGAAIGRSQEPSRGNRHPSRVFRLAKYAIRPVSTMAEPPRVPLTAFIAEDMSEFVHAHATYRFVIVDEEEERPRILVWLFKPNMRISYTIPTEYVIPKSATIHAAKVLYKFLGPETTQDDLHEILQRYPGFPQAEYLYYPINICRRLAAHLKESNTAYPGNMRTMTGLDVGWLQRI